MNQNNYFIKDGYRSRAVPKPFPDSEEDAVIYQVDVYRFAADIVKQHRLRSVLDIGCGFALKLVEHLGPLVDDFYGIDQSHSIEYCRSSHQSGTWIVDNLEEPQSIPDREFDLILSADVIEHLVDPDNLLSYIRACAHEDTLVILSTPERDLRRGNEDMGPPRNGAHAREWNQNEFTCYLQDRGFEILENRIVDLKTGMPTCQTVLCRAR